MAKNKKSGLGRGLGALMGEPVLEEPAATASVQDDTTEPEASTASVPPVPSNEADKPKQSDTVEGSDFVRMEQDAQAAESAPVHAREARTEEAPSTAPAASTNSSSDQVRIQAIVNRDAKVDGEVPLSKVVPNPDQPRTQFKKEEIEELAASIEKEGLLQPVVVRKVGEGYQIIAGERRWQACKSLGMKNIPIRIIEATDDKAVELALIENIQRSDLNPIEEAYGYKRLMERRGMTQSEVAHAVSKGRSTVANALRLLDLPEDAQQLLYEEKISAGHARAILSVPTKEGRQRLTDKLKSEKLTVRQTEAIARLMAGQSKNKNTEKRDPAPAYFKSAARSMAEKLQTNVRIRRVSDTNRVEIDFADEDELKRIFSALIPED